MATSTIPRGRIEVAARRGETLPVGWAIGPDGRPATTAKDALAGALLPLGGLEETAGYKGYGLSLMLGLLAGTLNGAAFGKNVVDANNDSRTPTNTGQTIIAVSVAYFCDPALFREQVEMVRRDFKAAPRMPGGIA